MVRVTPFVKEAPAPPAARALTGSRRAQLRLLPSSRMSLDRVAIARTGNLRGTPWTAGEIAP